MMTSGDNFAKFQRFGLNKTKRTFFHLKELSKLSFDSIFEQQKSDQVTFLTDYELCFFFTRVCLDSGNLNQKD